ncbi:MAG: DUF2007 domain-containing protein [Bacteroidia bacterium]|nr:DUF2007 domain-containing protein [Bacteroidia bacterium]
MDNFVLLKTYFSPIDAHNAMNFLDSHGIFSQIIGSTAATTYNAFNPGKGGVRLFVHKDELENAKSLLNQG